MEIKTMTNEELEIRIAEIETAMTAEDADLDALAAEMTEIEARKAELATAEEARQAEARKIAEGEIPGKTIEERKETKTMSEMEIRNSAAYVNAYAEYIKSGDDAECRALLTENASGVVAVPELVYDIVRTAWDQDGIMSRVRKAYLKGNLKVGFEISADPAYIHVEGSGAVTAESLVLGTVNIVPQSIKKMIQVSDEAMDLRGEAFLRWIYTELAYRIAKKAADTLVGLIKNAGTASTATAVGVPVFTATTVAMDTIANGLALLSDEAANPVIIMNKQSYPAFKAVQYANGYGADPFEGLPVLFNSTVSAYTAATSGTAYAIVGDLGEGALANFPNGEEITFKFDDLSLAAQDLVQITGREFVGLGIVGPGAFAKIVK